MRPDLTVPDHRIPHKITRDTEVYLKLNTAEGGVEQLVKIPAGWWVASPLVVDGTLEE